MARGRMLNATVATDKRLAGLSLESELLFLKALPHLDRDGLILGDASILWAQICPRRPELLPMTEAAVVEWIDAGLVVAYETDNGRALWFPNFTKNQAGFRYDREPPSTIDCPPGCIRTADGIVPDGLAHSCDKHPEACRQTSGKHPANIPLKRREVKENKKRIGKEEKEITGASARPSALPPAAQVFEANGGKWATGTLADGTPKRDRAIVWISERVADTPESLRLWADVVAGYCAQWSPHSYTVMVNDYYLKGRVPGEPRASPGGNGATKRHPGLTAVEMMIEEDVQNGIS